MLKNPKKAKKVANMKLAGMVCPLCGAGIEMDTKDKKEIYCPFCGGRIAIDNGEKIYTKNININKTVNHHYTDDAKVEHERNIDRENQREHDRNVMDQKKLAIIALIGLVTLLIGVFGPMISGNISTQSGLIKAGQSAEDMKDQNYELIVEQLKSAGFTNISTIDLDDAGWFTNKENTVYSVSIGGNAKFSSSDFFSPDAKVIVSYH